MYTYKSNFKRVLASYEAKYGKVFRFNCALRRFKRRYLTSKKKKAANMKAFYEELRKTFDVEPAVYYKDQPH